VGGDDGDLREVPDPDPEHQDREEHDLGNGVARRLPGAGEAIAREERPARRERDVKQAPKVNLR
jgi:hypothetical protein